MEIKSAEFITSMASYTNGFAGAGLRQVAICGKSNVGKSSLINRLCRRNKLARTSSRQKEWTVLMCAAESSVCWRCR